MQIAATLVRQSPVNTRTHSQPIRVAAWSTDLEQAKARAMQENKRILALFTGQ